jgi:hypothetical protein
MIYKKYTNDMYVTYLIYKRDSFDSFKLGPSVAQLAVKEHCCLASTNKYGSKQARY